MSRVLYCNEKGNSGIVFENKPWDRCKYKVLYDSEQVERWETIDFESGVGYQTLIDYVENYKYKQAIVSTSAILSDLLTDNQFVGAYVLKRNQK